MSNTKSHISSRKTGPHEKSTLTARQQALRWFGPKPLVKGESEANYDDLSKQVETAAEPTDFFEKTWCREIVDSLWEAQRWRRLKAALLESARHQGLKRLMGKPVCADQEVGLDEWVDLWRFKEPSALKGTKEALELMGLEDSAIDAHALAANIDLVEKFDVLIARADARRHFAMQEIRRNKEFAARMKQAAAAVLEGEFRELENGATAK